ncbi:nitroreductase family protein [Dysgonomonas sp. Marseille-P4677]|uniref:nitroreductase family protein n=1 Tax=Dysgonomonas sp. Marseille-P4677 TaxID=2364790 RepID=UPI001914D4A3|nr:nitroreductase family protein [Dysgonomonas sp. Marseille-P4677]MBK5719488.1 nitroreductase family protein [Dysgonomonas sp. Marseille-P4677]
MKLKELIENRYSVRAYLPHAVEEEKVNYILECARLAPSACNLQSWKFYIVTTKEAVSKVQESYNREWFKTAPMHIVVCKDVSVSWKRTNTDNKDFGDVDAAITAEHICLATAEVGLGTCWVCNFDPVLLKEALRLPENIEAIAIFPLGYIDTEKSLLTDKKRKLLSEVTERL